MKAWGKIPAAAEYAGVCVRTIRYWMQKGLRYSRLPTGAVLIKFADIDEYLEQFATTSSEEDALLKRICSELK
jgi:hypothetical protein